MAQSRWRIWKVIHTGENSVRGLPVDVERRKVRRISIRIKPNGCVALTVPKWGATLAEAEACLLSKWKWILKVRDETLARPKPDARPIEESELLALNALLKELNDIWTSRLSELGVTWKVRRLKSMWGSCHILKRCITYNAELARVPREMVEYVVVHELTHLKAASHGPKFYRLMDQRLPKWQSLRRRLNKREFESRQTPEPVRIVQSEFDFASM